MKKIGQEIIIGLFVGGLFLTVWEALAATNVSSAINQDTIWTLANSPYVVNGDVEVSSNFTRR